MKAINKQAKKVMDKLTGRIDGFFDHKIIDNTEGTFMPVHVEHVGNCKLGQIFSITHYFEQERDLMRDPDMEFIKGGDGEYYPVSFWQDAPVIRDEPVIWKDGDVVAFDVKRQAALASFANVWMKNISSQQKLGGLKPLPSKLGDKKNAN